MASKITRRAILGTLITALAAGPFIIRSFRKRDGWLAGFEQERQEYLEQLRFPREYKPFIHPRINQEDKDLIVQTHKRYWANFAQVRKAEFDYYSQTYDVGGIKENSFWDMNVHVKMEYEQGFEAKGVDSTGHPVDLTCTPDGCHIASARGNGGVSTLMLTFLGAFMARPDVGTAHTSMKKGVEMKPNPYIEGQGLYDVLVLADSERGNPENKFERLDYYSRETGMLDLQYTYFAPGVTHNRGTALGAVHTETEFFRIWQYELVGSVYLARMADAHCPQTKYRVENRFSNYTNVELWPNS